MNLKKIIENLFYATIFFLPWQTMWMGREPWVGGFKWEYGVMGVYGVDVLLVALLGLILIKWVKDTRYKIQDTNKSQISNLKSQGKANIKILNYKTLLFISSFLIFSWSLGSIFWSPDKPLAVYFSGKLLLALGLFWAVRRIEFSWKKLLMILLLAGALQGALGVGQFLLQGTFSSKWLGMSVHHAAQGGASVLENASGRWLRAYGSFPHPNMLGGYLAIMLLMIVGKGKSMKNFQFPISNFDSILNDIILKLKNYNLVQNSIRQLADKIQNSYHTLYYVSNILIFSGLIVSFSRSAWLVFVLGFGILFLLQKTRRKELKKMLIIFLGTALVWLAAFSPLFLARTQGEARLEKKSVDDRVEYVAQAREIIREHFWLGVGTGNYTKAVYENSPQKKIWEIQPVHNVFLLVWAELGLVGLVLWLGFLGNIFLVGYKKNKTFTLVLYAACCMLYVLDHWLWDSHFGLLFFFLLLGLILREKEVEMG